MARHLASEGGLHRTLINAAVPSDEGLAGAIEAVGIDGFHEIFGLPAHIEGYFAHIADGGSLVNVEISKDRTPGLSDDFLVDEHIDRRTFSTLALTVCGDDAMKVDSFAERLLSGFSRNCPTQHADQELAAEAMEYVNSMGVRKFRSDYSLFNAYWSMCSNLTDTEALPDLEIHKGIFMKLMQYSLRAQGKPFEGYHRTYLVHRRKGLFDGIPVESALVSISGAVLEYGLFGAIVGTKHDCRGCEGMSCDGFGSMVGYVFDADKRFVATNRVLAEVPDALRARGKNVACMVQVSPFGPDDPLSRVDADLDNMLGIHPDSKKEVSDARRLVRLMYSSHD